MYSVGIPVRNEENTLEDCVNSVLNQTLSPAEILICVNGSTDRTLDIAKGLERQEGLVKVLQSKPGKPNAWNKIVSESKQDRILFTDGDALLSRNSGEDLFKHLEDNPDNYIVSGGVFQRYQGKETFCTLALEEEHNVLVHPFLSGALYMIDMNLMEDLSKRSSMVLMPREVIAEDNYLGLLAELEMRRGVISSGYAVVNSLNSLKDYYFNIRRGIQALKQFEEEYPKLARVMSSYKKTDDILELDNNPSNLIRKFLKTKGIKKKIGKLAIFAISRYLLFSESFSSRPRNNLWSETRSTKVPFPSQITKSL